MAKKKCGNEESFLFREWKCVIQLDSMSISVLNILNILKYKYFQVVVKSKI